MVKKDPLQKMGDFNKFNIIKYEIEETQQNML